MIVRPDEYRAMEFRIRDKEMSKGDFMELPIYMKEIVRAMIIAVLIITLVSFVARVAMYMCGVEGYLHRGNRLMLVGSTTSFLLLGFFSFSVEGNLDLANR